MKTITSLLVFIISCITLSAQTVEPSPLSFNWGSHSGPFHDSTQKQTKPVIGWQWGASDSSFDAYMHANTWHGGADYPDLDTVHTGKNINIVKEYDNYRIAAFRFDPEVTPNFTTSFRPHRYDSSGAAFGWEALDTSTVTLDTATSVRPKGYAVLQGGGTGLALSGIRPNNRLKRMEDIPDVVKGINQRGRTGTFFAFIWWGSGELLDENV